MKTMGAPSESAALASRAVTADGGSEVGRKIIENFDIIAEAPGGVEALRKVILDLAVAGRLTGASRTHWPEVSVRSAFATMFTGPFGTSLKASDYVAGGTPVVNPQNLRGGRIVPTDDTCVGPATLRRLSSFLLAEGDVVVARRGEMGRCAVVGRAEAGWLCGTGSFVLRPSVSIDPLFAALFVRSPQTVATLAGESVGATMQNLNQRIMASLRLVLPPLAEQKRIVAKVDQLMALCEALEKKLLATEDLRSRLAHSLVAAAMNGGAP